MRVRMRPHVRFERHEYRGRPWYILQDEATGRTHRLSAAAYDVVARFDGLHSLEELQAEAARRLGAEAPSAEELVSLVGTLYRADMLTADTRPDFEELAARSAELRRQRFKQYFLNPLALRLPLIDPDRGLARAAAAIGPVPAWAWVSAWLAVVACGVAIAATNWPTLSEGAFDRIFSIGNLVILWFTYPLVKLVHELAHGVVIRRFGGQVHEMGVMLLVMIPVPYVEASAAAAFPSKRARMLVGAAGVLSELFLAGLAMLAWALLEPGTLRAICFNVALIAGVSTVIFNGNPLLRFDGYYVLADFLEIPNLAQRSSAYLGYLVQRFAFGVREAASPAATSGEARWMLAYGTLAAVYRVFVVVSIILLVATKFFFVGIALALWGVLIMVVRPVWTTALFLARSPQLASHRRRAVATAGGLLAAILAVVFLVPVPQWTRSEGVVWAPESAQVRTGTACWIRRVIPGEGARVAKGDRLFECEDPELPARVRLLEQQLEELHARDRAYFVDSRLNLDVVREEIVHTEARLADARRRLNGLVVLSPVDGRFVFPGQADAPGRFVQRGELVAYVVEPGPATVRVVVDQADVDLIRAATRAVAIKPADRVAETLPARMTREVPGASERLPSLALGVPGGGAFAVDPRSLTDPREEASPRAMVPVFQFDLEVAPESRLDAIGLRVFVRFDHPPEPLARQWYRAARRVMLKVFEV